jgi:hypothetical protein
MRESDLWKYLRQGLLGKCHMTRIESSAGNGVPDVSLGLPGKNAWIELKYIPSWPKRSTTKVKLPLRPEQKHWIQARGSISGNVWVLVRIENDFFLLDWVICKEAAEEGWTKQEWRESCSVYKLVWYNRIDFDELWGIINE